MPALLKIRFAAINLAGNRVYQALTFLQTRFAFQQSRSADLS